MTPRPPRADALALIELAERAASGYGPDQERRARELHERANEVVAAIERFLEIDPGLALRLVAALPAFWADIGRVDEGRRLTLAAIEAAPEGAPALAAGELAASELAFRQGDQAEAQRHARSAINGASSRGNDRIAALAHVNLARVAYRNGDAEEIEAHAQRAIEVAGAEIAVRRAALHMLAWAAHTGGDIVLAQERFHESLELRRSQGDRFGAAVEIANLADLATEQGDLHRAGAWLAEALEVAVELDNQYLILNLLPSIAALAATRGDDEAAAHLVGATDALSDSTGLVADPGNWQPVLDEAAHRLGDRFDVLRAEGRALGFAEALEIARRAAA